MIDDECGKCHSHPIHPDRWSAVYTCPQCGYSWDRGKGTHLTHIETQLAVAQDALAEVMPELGEVGLLLSAGEQESVIDAATRRIERMRVALETIIKNRVEDGGPCDANPMACGCSECIARVTLAAIDKEG